MIKSHRFNVISLILISLAKRVTLFKTHVTVAYVSLYTQQQPIFYKPSDICPNRNAAIVATAVTWNRHFTFFFVVPRHFHTHSKCFPETRLRHSRRRLGPSRLQYYSSPSVDSPGARRHQKSNAAGSAGFRRPSDRAASRSRPLETRSCPRCRWARKIIQGKIPSPPEGIHTLGYK